MSSPATIMSSPATTRSSPTTTISSPATTMSLPTIMMSSSTITMSSPIITMSSSPIAVPSQATTVSSPSTTILMLSPTTALSSAITEISSQPNIISLAPTTLLSSTTKIPSPPTTISSQPTTMPSPPTTMCSTPIICPTTMPSQPTTNQSTMACHPTAVQQPHCTSFATTMSNSQTSTGISAPVLTTSPPANIPGVSGRVSANRYHVNSQSLKCAEFCFTLGIHFNLGPRNNSRVYRSEMCDLHKLTTALLDTCGGHIHMHRAGGGTPQDMDTWRGNLIEQFKRYIPTDVYEQCIDWKEVNGDPILVITKSPKFISTHTHLQIRGIGHNQQVNHFDEIRQLLHQPKSASETLILEASYQYGDVFRYTELKNVEFKYFKTKSIKELVDKLTTGRNHGLLFAMANTAGGGYVLIGIDENTSKSHILVHGQILTKQEQHLITAAINNYLLKDENGNSRIWGSQGYVPKQGYDWDIEFIPVLNGPEMKCKSRCHKCPHSERYVICMYLKQFIGGVFMKEPESWRVDDDGLLHGLTFEEWLHEHGGVSARPPQIQFPEMHPSTVHQSIKELQHSFAQQAATQQSVNQQSSTQQCVTQQSATLQFTTQQSVNQQSTTQQSVTQQSVNGQSVTQQSVNQQSTTQQSVTQHLVNQQSTTHQSVNQQSTTQQSVTQHLVNQQSGTQQSVNQQSTTQQSVNQQSTTQQSVNQQSTTQQSVNQHSVAQQSINQQSVTQQSINQQSVTQQFVNAQLANQQSANQQLSTLMVNTLSFVQHGSYRGYVPHVSTSGLQLQHSDVDEFDIFEFRQPVNFTPKREVLLYRNPNMENLLIALEQELGEAFSITSINMFDCFANDATILPCPHHIRDMLMMTSSGQMIVSVVCDEGGTPDEMNAQVTYACILTRVIKKRLLDVMSKDHSCHRLSLHIQDRVYRLTGSHHIRQMDMQENVFVSGIKLAIALMLLEKRGSLYDAVGEQICFHYSPKQMAATLISGENPLVIIRGAPGTGKSLVLQEICHREGNAIYFCTTKSTQARVNHRGIVEALYVRAYQEILGVICQSRYRDRTCIAIDDAQNLTMDNSSLSRLCSMENTKLVFCLDSAFHNYRSDDAADDLENYIIRYSKVNYEMLPSIQTLTKIFRNTDVVTAYMKSGFDQKKQRVMESGAPRCGDDVKVTKMAHMSLMTGANGILKHVRKLCAESEYLPRDTAILIDRDSDRDAETNVDMMIRLFQVHWPQSQPQRSHEPFPVRGVVIDSLVNFIGADSKVIIVPVWKESVVKLGNPKYRCAVVSRAIDYAEFYQEEIRSEHTTFHGMRSLPPGFKGSFEGLTNPDSIMWMAGSLGDVGMITDLLMKMEQLSDQDYAQFLFGASTSGHMDVLKLLKEKGADLSVKDNNGESLLHGACLMGQESVVEWLIANGGNLTETSNGGWTPLHYAVDGGHLSMVQSFTQSGVDLSIKNNDGRTLLHVACSGGQEAIVEWLIHNGADVSEVDKDGCTPLHYACHNGHIPIVEYLTQRGAELRVRSNDGRTLLHVACSRGQAAMAEWLINNGADLTEKDKDGWTPLHYTCSEGAIPMAVTLVQRGACLGVRSNDGRTLLHVACSEGQVSMAEWLIDNGADVTETDNDGWTPLGDACNNGHIHTVQSLVNRGADLSVRSNDGETLLHAACCRGQRAMAEWLIENGSSPTETDNDKWTTLHYACNKGHISMAQCLIQRGADLTARDRDGETLLHVASRQGQVSMAEWLIDNGADVTEVDNDGWTALHHACNNGHLSMVKCLTQRGADTHVRDNIGRTLLHVTCSAGQVSIAGWLVDNGADITDSDSDGSTALHHACDNGHLPIVQCLAQLGADLSVTNNIGETLLHVSCREGHVSMVEWLIDNGNADLNDMDDAGWTPLHVACDNGQISMVQCLIQRGADMTAMTDDNETVLQLVMSGVELSMETGNKDLLLLYLEVMDYLNQVYPTADNNSP